MTFDEAEGRIEEMIGAGCFTRLLGNSTLGPRGEATARLLAAEQNVEWAATIVPSPDPILLLGLSLSRALREFIALVRVVLRSPRSDRALLGQ